MFKEMALQKVSPTCQTYALVINILSLQNRIEEAKALFNRAKGLFQDSSKAVVYGAMLDTFSRADLDVESKDLWQEMKDANVSSLETPAYFF